MAIMDTFHDVAYALSKNGFGKSLGFNSIDVGRSASYNKIAGAANGIIKNMETEEAQAVRNIIKKGEDFNNGAFADALTSMAKGNDDERKIAEAFSELYDNYKTASKSNTMSSYAEFLGHKSGTYGLKNTASGYFLDKEYGKTRMMAAAGTAAGVGVVGRYLSGGSITRTNTGERDIAGIPFI